MEEQNFLGIDWGENKLGIALAHGETRIAMAYGIFKNTSLFLEELKKIIQKEEVGTIVVGIPRYQGKISEEHPARKFGQNLERVLKKKIIYTNEMFTSKLAQDSLKILGGKNVGASDDAEAAKILLQEWLDQGAL